MQSIDFSWKELKENMLVFKGKNNLKPGESEKRDFSV